MVECNACGGTYEPMGADGVRYAHVCPPVTCLVVTRGKKRQTVRITDVRPDDLVVVLRDGAKLQIARSALKAGDVLIEQHHVERPNARNENPARDEDGNPSIVSHGDGVTSVLADVSSAPAFPPLQE